MEFKKKNKKGQIFAGLTIGVAIVVALLILIFTAGILNFLKNNIFILLGAFLFVGGLIYLIKSTSNTRTKTTVFFVLLIIGSILVFSNGVLQQAAVEGAGPKLAGHFEAPFFCSLQCDEAQGTPSVQTIKIDLTQVSPKNFIKCPDNADSCVPQVNYPPQSGLIIDPRRVEFYICDHAYFDNSCATPDVSIRWKEREGLQYRDTTSLPKGKAMYIEFQKWEVGSWNTDSRNYGTVNLRFVPYYLWTDCALDGGRNPFIFTPTQEDYIAGCDIGKVKLTHSNLNDILKKGVLSESVSEDLTSEDIQDSNYNPNKNKLTTKESFNYIKGTVTRATFGNTVRYNNQDGYCQLNIQGKGTVIYGFGEIATPEATYSVVDTGKVLAQSPDVECCEEGKKIGNKVCENFKWKELQVNVETGETNEQCTPISDPCNPGRFVLNTNDKTTNELECINNQCVISDVRVEECVETKDCSDNKICLNWKCVQAGVIPGAETEDGKEDGDTSTCNPIFEQEISVDKTVGRGPLGIGKLFGWTKIETEKKCAPKSWVPIAVFGTIILILGLAAILVNKKPRRQSQRRRR